MNISKHQKKINKINNLKNKIDTTVEKLRSIDLEETFGPDFISPYSYNTIYDIDRILTRIENCSTEIHIQTSGENFRIIERKCCGVSCICAICASVKRNRIQQEIKPYIDTMKMIPGVRFYMITATIRNVIEPGDGYEKLRQSWTKFIKMGQKREGFQRSGGEASKIDASIFSLETVKENNNTALFNTHAHILVVCREPIDYRVYNQESKSNLQRKYGYGNIPKEELDKIALKRITNNGKEINVSKIQEEWILSTDGDTNIRVDELYDGKKNPKGQRMSLEKQLYEVVKYETKPFDVEDPLDLLKIFDSVSGKRRTTKAGWFTMRNVEAWENVLNENNLTETFWKAYYKNTEFVWDDNLTVYNTISYKWIPSDEPFLYDGSLEINPKAKLLDNYEKYSEICRRRGYQIRAVNKYRKELKILRDEYKSEKMTAKEYVDTKELLYKSFKVCSLFCLKEFVYDEFERKMILNVPYEVQSDMFFDVVQEIIEDRCKRHRREYALIEEVNYCSIE